MSLRGYSFNDGRPTNCRPVGIGPGSKITPVWTREPPGHPTWNRCGVSVRALYDHRRQSRRIVYCNDTRYNVLLVCQRWRSAATPSRSNRRVGWGGVWFGLGKLHQSPIPCWSTRAGSGLTAVRRGGRSSHESGSSCMAQRFHPSINLEGGKLSDGGAAWQPQQLIRAAVRANRSEITVGSVARGGRWPFAVDWTSDRFEAACDMADLRSDQGFTRTDRCVTFRHKGERACVGPDG